MIDEFLCGPSRVAVDIKYLQALEAEHEAAMKVESVDCPDENGLVREWAMTRKAVEALRKAAK